MGRNRLKAAADVDMWEQEEFAKHWRNEFPDGEVPRMNLNSVADIESELEICKSNLKRLQKALAEEKFKVIYLQTTMDRRQRSDPERAAGQDENFNADPAACSIPVSGRKPQRRDHAGDRPRSMVQEPGGAKPHGAGHSAAVTSSLAPERSRFSGRMGKPVPIPVPPRMMSFTIVEPTATKNDSEPGSDREYEDAELNDNFVRNNLLTPRSSHRDARRAVRHSRDFDDDGWLSPSLARLDRRASRGSGCSTPERRSDGYLSSDHEDSSSAGEGAIHAGVAATGQGGWEESMSGQFIQRWHIFTHTPDRSGVSPWQHTAELPSQRLSSSVMGAVIFGCCSLQPFRQPDTTREVPLVQGEASRRCRNASIYFNQLAAREV